MRKLLLILMLSPLFVLAQSVSHKVEKRLITDSWTVSPASFDDDMELSIRPVAAPFPSGEGDRQFLVEQKAKSAALYPRSTATNIAGRDARSSGDSLMILDSFAVRFFLNDFIMTGGTPNDNTLAISNDGKLIASYNSQLWGYDIEADTFLFKSNNPHPSFNQFLNNYTTSGISIGSSAFDPKLFYHPDRDRFVFLFLTDGQDTLNSSTVIAFSSSNDPSDDWYAYRLDGNPFLDGTWTDYPQIALNDHSLYLTLNQLSGPSWVADFDQTIIWQLDLDAAFSGQTTLSTVIHSGFEHEGKSLRYLRPVKTAFGPQGENMYFLSNRPRDIQNDSIWIIELTGDVDHAAIVNQTVVKSNVSYGIPPYAHQAAGHTFWTNDARPLGAMRIQNEIHFVGNTINTDNGLAAIFHGIIKDVTSPTVEGYIISDDVLEFGFPNIEFMGITETDRDMIINFNHTSPTDFAGNAAVYVNNEGEHGPTQLLKKGTTYVDMISQAFDVNERWGDYIGLQRQYSKVATAWAAGYVSYGNKRNGTWITEVATPRNGPTGKAEVVELRKPIVFPNPTADFVSFEFQVETASIVTIKLFDMQGKLVRNLNRKNVMAGKNVVSFNIHTLPSGVYTLQLADNEGIIATEKVVRN